MRPVYRASFAFAVASLILQSAPSARADVDLLYWDGHQNIAIRNEIKPGDEVKFESMLVRTEQAGKPVRSVILNSGGGHLLTAFKIAGLMSVRGMSATVLPHGACASACILPYVVATPRYFGHDAHVGVHAVSSVDPDGKRLEAPRETAIIADLLLRLGAPYTITNKLKETPGTSIAWLSEPELLFMNARRYERPDAYVKKRDLTVGLANICAMKHLLLGNGHDGEKEYVKDCVKTVEFDVGNLKEFYLVGISTKMVGVLYLDHEGGWDATGSRFAYPVDGVEKPATIDAIGMDGIDVVQADGTRTHIPYDNGALPGPSVGAAHAEEADAK